MNRFRFEIVLAALFVAMTGAVWLWQNPGVLQGPLDAQEIDRYVDSIEKLPFPADEKPGILVAARAWMDHDDGKPVYMLNLMRALPGLRQYEGAVPFAGTPAESNALYERSVRRLLLRQGGYPAYAGSVSESNVMSHDPALDHWSRVLLIRYPSRRAFLNLVTDPRYPALLPFKVMAMQVVLTPTTREAAVPDLPKLVGGALLVLFLVIGWWRASRRAR